jgi:hypothetical protein
MHNGQMKLEKYKYQIKTYILNLFNHFSIYCFNHFCVGDFGCAMFNNGTPIFHNGQLIGKLSRSYCAPEVKKQIIKQNKRMIN